MANKVPARSCLILRKARLKRGLTQVDLATMLNLKAQSIANVECGAATPSVKWLYKACFILNIDPKVMARAFADAEYERILDAVHDQQVLGMLNHHWGRK